MIAQSQPRAETTNVLGVGVSRTNLASAAAEILSWSDGAVPGGYVCVSGVHGVMESQKDHALRRIHNAASLVVPDGMPLVWMSWLHGHRQVGRVYGPDLMLEICGREEGRSKRHFFYGGNDGVADLLAERLCSRFPGLQVAGTYCPPFRPLTEAEDEEVVAKINASEADIVWVGLSTPKQERWMASHVGRINAAALIGVGAAFDFHAGLKSQAPYWMQRTGLEWSYRLATEPRRLWRRYVYNNPRFLMLVAAQLLGIRRFRTDIPDAISPT